MTDSQQRKGIRGNVQTLSIEDFKDLLKNRGSDSGRSKSGKKQDARRIFSEVFREDKVINSLLNEEYKELFELVDEFKKFYGIRADNPDDMFKSIGSLLQYSPDAKNAKKKYRATNFLDNLFFAFPSDKDQIQGLLVNYGLDTANKELQDKFKTKDEELDKVVSELTKIINKETLETMGEIPEEEKGEDIAVPPVQEEGIPEKVDATQEEQDTEAQEREELRDLENRGKVVMEEAEDDPQDSQQEEEPETLEEILSEREDILSEQNPDPDTEQAAEEAEETEEQEPEVDATPQVQMEVERPLRGKTETISNPVGQNLIDQIPKEMISTQFKNIEELKEEIEFLLDKFPRLLRREKEIYSDVDLEDIDQLRRLHKTIIGKLGADRTSQQIAVVIPAEDYIKAEVNKILLDTALKNMRAEDIIQTINMPNRQGETDGLTVGDFVVREGNTSGLQNQGQPIYRYIPTTNQEVEEQQTRTGKIRLNTTKRTRLNVAKREFRNDPFIFRRPQPIRLKYLG